MIEGFERRRKRDKTKAKKKEEKKEKKKRKFHLKLLPQKREVNEAKPVLLLTNELNHRTVL